MKRLQEISARKVVLGLVVWLLVTNLLVWAAHTMGWLPLKVILFLCVSFLPGVAIVRAMRIVVKNLTVGVLYSFGLSMLVLMLSGLGANQLFFIFTTRPLALPGVVIAWNIATLLLILLGLRFNPKPVRSKSWAMASVSKSAWLLLALSALLPISALAGAIRLNNGGDALIAAGTVCAAAALIVYAFLLRRRLPDGILALFIFSLSLTVLLMTSLRGWDIVGHDIEHEFRVYNLLQMYGHWDIGLNRDPYNACLSITILPWMFSKLLDVSGLVVFKLILQVIFAACPAVIFVLLRRYVSVLGALVGSVLFICYPTFINDSAMLTRQGVAYLFFALALLVIANKVPEKRYKLLFLTFSLGAILSHYSTAYMFVGLFAVAVVCKYIISRLLVSSVRLLRQAPKVTVLSPLFATLLFLMAFIWYSQITATSSGLITTARQSLASIPQLFSSDNKSSDTSVALLFASNKTQVSLYESYLSDSSRSSAEAITAEYIPTLTSEDVPLTDIGKKAGKVGIHPSFIALWRQNFAKVLQLLAVAGTLYAIVKLLRGKHDSFDPDFIYLSLASIVLLFLLVVLPVLSINYGVLRAFQQALIFLLLPITILLTRIGQLMWSYVKIAAITTSMVFLFLLFTGLFAQLLGGSSPSLSMNNRGLYYGSYYATKADAYSFAWLKDHVPERSDVRAANFNKAVMHDPKYPFDESDILPSQIGPNTYVYLDAAQVVKQRLYTRFEHTPLIMTFPLGYYDAARNQVYSTQSTRVYH